MRGPNAVARRPARASPSPSPSSDSEASSPRPTKRRKTTSSSASKAETYRSLIRQPPSTPKPCDIKPSLPPTRAHTLSYHRPLLLDPNTGASSRTAFLTWFDSVSQTRAMPWRKAWVDPSSFGTDEDALRLALEKRAYEVWISEIMLQQTRVAVVIDYWNKWMDKWPTIQDLAAASPDDVLAAWRGLGYYSRATRIHEAAKLAVADSTMKGLLPSSAKDLADKIPGVGRYTAGAISCIAFGRPAPMVDGNVLRVLSRQLGIYGNIKTDKAVIDIIWVAAEELVNAVALDGHSDNMAAADDTRSDRPGRWGQALMELGSTVCAPKPNCAECPITSTCRAYNEGLAITQKSKSKTSSEDALALADMEDLCTVCEPFDETDDVENKPPVAAAKGGKQATLSAFFTKSIPAKSKSGPKIDIEGIVNHTRRFPVKAVKKAVREEETLVCAVVRSDGRFLIHKRPAKGLLAGLWEFPSAPLQNPKELKPAQRKKQAREHMEGVLSTEGVEHVGELGSVPWLFSHIKLTMHVHLFRMEGREDVAVGGATSGRWTDDVDGESMGTGMRKCWGMVKDAV